MITENDNAGPILALRHNDIVDCHMEWKYLHVLNQRRLRFTINFVGDKFEDTSLGGSDEQNINGITVRGEDI